MRRALPLIVLCACGRTAASTTPPIEPDPPRVPPAALGSFAVYLWLPKVDPFPDVPGGDGWGLASNASATTHCLALQADPSESAAQALARRGEPAPHLPPGVRLISQPQTPYSGLDWSLRSIVDRPNIVISTSEPIIEAARDTRLFLALGDDVVNDWTPGGSQAGAGAAELQIPQPDARMAHTYAARNPQLCPHR